jgi:16S rRNA (cytosine967-C5)-methyltransferase
MTPAARVQAAIELLDAILSGIPAEKALTGWARKSRFAGSKDRVAIRDHVFHALRCKRSFAVRGGGLTGRGLMIGALRAAGADPDAIFTGARYAPAPLSEDERKPGEPEARDRMDLPDWLIDRFEASLGDSALPTALALRDRAPVMARVHLGKTTRDNAIAALAEEGIIAHPDPAAASALRIEEGARRLASSRAYCSGLLELQDGSSQAAMEWIAVAPGARVLDYCAGGGGKLLALAAQAQGRWFAHDANAQRMADLPARAARAGVEVSILEGRDLRGTAPFDLVLCDAPCSGSGTWRRTPDMKWRLTPARLAELIEVQTMVLDEGAQLVAEAGRLAYATCSVLQEENEAQVAAFLARHPAWHCEDRHAWPVSAHGDGFYLAILTRK